MDAIQYFKYELALNFEQQNTKAFFTNINSEIHIKCKVNVKCKKMYKLIQKTLINIGHH